MEVSSRSQTQDFARERAELLEAVLDGISEGVLATDLEGRVLFANPAARAMLGMGQDRVTRLDEPQELPDPFEDFDLPRAVARCAEAGECPEAVASGGGDPLRVRLRPLEEFGDHRGGVLAIFQEPSNVRRLEARQQRFLSIAAHELKTPLTAIIGIADLLQDEEKLGVRRRFLGHLDREAHRVRDLSETLLRIARTGYDQREPNLEPIELLEAAREAAERAEPLALPAGLKLCTVGEGGRVLADREWLEQILLAVLDNAMKYSEPGGVVTLRTGSSSLAVEDKGSGISEEDLPYVFELLYRGGCGAEVRREGSSGAGLGLPVSRDLVERMGGRIFAESREGDGTRVRIELPEAVGDACERAERLDDSA